jgi:hypothetical protein
MTPERGNGKRATAFGNSNEVMLLRESKKHEQIGKARRALKWNGMARSKGSGEVGPSRTVRGMLRD